MISGDIEPDVNTSGVSPKANIATAQPMHKTPNEAPSHKKTSLSRCIAINSAGLR